MAENAKMDPLEIEKLKKEQKELREKKDAQRKAALEEAKVAINSAAGDPNVRIVLRVVMSLAGFQDNPVAIVEGKVDHASLEYNVGREAVYHDLRKFMSAETKNVVERSE